MATAPSKRGAIYSRMGRPSSSEVLPTFDTYIREVILNMRRQHPGWGAKTIRTELSLDPRYRGFKLPSIRSIGTLLKAAGLVRRYDKHVVIPNTERCVAQRAHQVWQLDAQGNFFLPGVGPIAMLNIKDVYSKVYCMTYPNQKKSVNGFSTRLDYQCALRLAFMEYGLPECIQTDHESIFHENKGKSPFPTLFHLWLVGLGITKTFSRIKQPTDQALVERMHQTIEKQVMSTTPYSNWEAFFYMCQNRRKFLNHELACSSLNDLPPFDACLKAKHSGKYYHPAHEEQLLQLERIFKLLSAGKWYRRASKTRSVTLGGQVYYVAKAKPQSQLCITFESKTRMLHFHDDKELLIQKLPIKGICKKRIMGDTFWKLVNIQLELPLFWETQKLDTIFLHNVDTT